MKLTDYIKNVNMELNTILNIMDVYKLTADELLLVYLTLLAQDEEGHPEYFTRWYEFRGKDNLKDLFNSLKEKKIINKSFNPSTYNPNEIDFNKNFINGYFKQSKVIGLELFEKYESFIEINGKQFSLKNVSKKFYSLEEFAFWYASTIGHSKSKHQEIMDLLSWARENKLIKYNILEFVASQKWLELKQLKDNGVPVETSTTFDIYQSL